MTWVQYLGYIVDEHKVHVDLTKIHAIYDWSAPTTLMELHSFLGLANFYRKFVLGFSHIASPLIQVNKGGGKDKFVWAESQKKSFEELKHHLCSTPILTLPNLQQPFEIETYPLDYVVGAILTQHGNLVEYHSKTISNGVCKYPTYAKDMYSIIQSYQQWKHYIIWKETVIHTNHKPLRVIQIQGKLENDHHQKWSTYLQQFHLNIKYKKGSTNRVSNFLIQPPISTLTMVINSCGHDTSRWSQFYASNHDFATTYQTVKEGTLVANFHLQDVLLCHLGHLYVPSSEHTKLIWESHYSWFPTYFGMVKTMAMFQKYFYWLKLQQDVSKYIILCIAYAIVKLAIKK